METVTAEGSFKRIANALLDQVASRANRDGVPEAESVRLVFTAHGWHTEVQRFDDIQKVLPKPSDIARDYDDAIRTVAARITEVLAESGSPSPPIAKSEFSEGDIQYVSRELWLHVLMLCGKVESFTPTPDELDTSWASFIQEMTARPGNARRFSECIVPLVGLESDLNEQPMGKLFVLKQFTPESKTNVWGRLTVHGQPTTEHLHFAPYRRASLILYHLQEGTAAGAVGQDFQEEVYRILTALRLLKSQDVGSVGTFELTGSTGHFNFGDPLSCHDPSIQSPYRFQRRDIPGFQRLYDALPNTLHRGGEPLAVALRRFHTTYTRRSLEDQVIDLAIAFESSLLSGQEQELTYRLGLRGTALLREVRRPQLTNALLTLLYSVRSKVVHEGEGVDGKNNARATRKVLRDADLTPREIKDLGGLDANGLPNAGRLVALWRDLARDVLRQYVFEMSAGKTLAEVNASLDRQIVAGSAHKLRVTSYRSLPSSSREKQAGGTSSDGE